MVAGGNDGGGTCGIIIIITPRVMLGVASPLPPTPTLCPRTLQLQIQRHLESERVESGGAAGGAGSAGAPDGREAGRSALER